MENFKEGFDEKTASSFSNRFVSDFAAFQNNIIQFSKYSDDIRFCKLLNQNPDFINMNTLIYKAFSDEIFSSQDIFNIISSDENPSPKIFNLLLQRENIKTSFNDFKDKQSDIFHSFLETPKLADEFTNRLDNLSFNPFIRTISFLSKNYDDILLNKIKQVKLVQQNFQTAFRNYALLNNLKKALKKDFQSSKNLKIHERLEKEAAQKINNSNYESFLFS